MNTEQHGRLKRFASLKGYKSWSAPAVIADTPFQSDGNPVVWQAPDGMVWLFYVNLQGETWSEAKVRAKISTDGAARGPTRFRLVMSLERWCVANPSC